VLEHTANLPVRGRRRGNVVAFSALLPGRDWSSREANVVLVIAATARCPSLGRKLAQTMLVEAVEHGFTKVTTNIAAENAGSIAMFHASGSRAGFAARSPAQPRGRRAARHRDPRPLVEETYTTMLVDRPAP
jgi:hypothetical protein